jgi:hypothetical protein
VDVRVKAEDSADKAQRESWANRVRDYFGPCLPESKLLCFLDDEDPAALRQNMETQIEAFTGLCTTTWTYRLSFRDTLGAVLT